MTFDLVLPENASITSASPPPALAFFILCTFFFGSAFTQMFPHRCDNIYFALDTHDFPQFVQNMTALLHKILKGFT